MNKVEELNQYQWLKLNGHTVGEAKEIIHNVDKDIEEWLEQS